MGGALFTEERMNRQNYLELADYVIKKLNDAGFKDVRIPKTFDDKDSFGDLDVLIGGSMPTDVALKASYLCQHMLWPSEFYKNGNTFSYDHHGFQVDLIFIPEHLMENAYNYFSYGDLGNLIGVIATAKGLKWGWQGFFYRIEGHKDILLSTDWRDALMWCHLDWMKHQDEGFKNEEEAFQWLMQSIDFMPEKFYYENLNNNNRTRNRKRAMYNRFVNYLQNYDWKNSFSDMRDNIAHKPTVHDLTTFGFPHLETELAEIKQAKQEKELLHQYFNGNIVMEITGLKDRELGKFIHDFLEYYPKEKLLNYIRNEESWFIPNLIRGYQLWMKY